MKLHPNRVALFTLAVSPALAVPQGFPSSGNGLWYTSVGNIWSRTWLPIGNGYLGAMLPGGTYQETTQLNLESLWSGGPFQDPNYNGGNKLPSDAARMAAAFKQIRQTIFSSSSGTIDNITVISDSPGAYGSYSGAGNIISTFNNPGGNPSNYFRWLDLDDAIHHTTWNGGSNSYSRETFCSNPSRACSQYLSVASGTLPTVTIAWTDKSMSNFPTPTITCFDSSTLRIRGVVAQPGMAYEILVRGSSTGGSTACSSVPVSNGRPSNATLTFNGAQNVWIRWVGDTEYSMDAGDSAHNYTFKGTDPHNSLVSLISAVPATYTTERASHVQDVHSILGKFSLDIGGKTQNNVNTPTDSLLSSYQVDTGNPYLEWITFNYGRYMLFSSARGVLPANLQGKWAYDSNAPWSADYHANINLQMNYWLAHITNMDVTQPIWNYIQKTWEPRGEYTAKVLYNVSRGWTTHDEMNIFGHTGIKYWSTYWATSTNYPEAHAWMAIHLYDRLAFLNDVSWWKSQGYPLLKSIALFHLDFLVKDDHFKDGTLVTAPCNSPEQGQITFGCTHQQHLIWMLFNAIQKGASIAGETDQSFLQEVQTKQAALDKGIKIGSWGELQEWKMGFDNPSDTHRHLSHLIGVFPAYSIINYDPSLQTTPGQSYTKAQVLAAAKTSLQHRGNGTGPDADSGWEKVWRAAQWAQFGDATTFYHELTYSLKRNFGANLFSLYDPQSTSPIFQIDANLGYPGALMNALLQTPDVPNLNVPYTITLLPALPKTWPTGSIKAARARGGITVDLFWSNSKATNATLTVDANAPARSIVVVYNGQTVSSFTSSPGQTKTLTF